MFETPTAGFELQSLLKSSPGLRHAAIESESLWNEYTNEKASMLRYSIINHGPCEFTAEILDCSGPGLGHGRFKNNYGLISKKSEHYVLVMRIGRRVRGEGSMAH